MHQDSPLFNEKQNI